MSCQQCSPDPGCQARAGASPACTGLPCAPPLGARPGLLTRPPRGAPTAATPRRGPPGCASC
eukprot:9661815-Lingulodinium_polyedra.AAC.1